MKARTKLLFLSLSGAFSLLAGCTPAPSPLYVSSKVGSTIGEIPRDTRGEPLWATLRRGQPAPPAPVYPNIVGTPVTPPPGN